MTIQNNRADKPEVAIEPGALSTGELDTISGGTPKGYHECVLGSAAGGGPGLYPTYVACRMK